MIVTHILNSTAEAKHLVRALGSWLISSGSKIWVGFICLVTFPAWN